MSCYEWESGTIKLPRKEWSKFKKDVIAAYNDWLLELLVKAEKLREKLLAAGFRKRGFDYARALREDEDKDGNRLGFDLHYREYDVIEDLLFPCDETTKARPLKPKAPKKKLLKLLPKKATHVSLGEARISFNDASRSVGWSVSENNHACDDAHEHPVAQAFFSRLNRVEWTRGSGGTIVGNDEYNREGEEEGGGGNYVKQRFGPDQPKKYTGYGVARYAY